MSLSTLMGSNAPAAGTLTSGIMPPSMEMANLVNMPQAPTASPVEQAFDKYKGVKQFESDYGAQRKAQIPNVPLPQAQAQAYTSNQNNDWIAELLNKNRSGTGGGWRY